METSTDNKSNMYTGKVNVKVNLQRVNITNFTCRRLQLAHTHVINYPPTLNRILK